MRPRRARSSVLLGAPLEGSLAGAMAGAVVGVVLGPALLLMGPAPLSVNRVCFALGLGGFEGILYGTLIGLVIGTAMGVLTGLVLVCAGVNRLNRLGARTIGAVTPAIAAALVAWSAHGRWPIIIALVFTALAAPLGAWRAPYVLDGAADPDELPRGAE